MDARARLVERSAWCRPLVTGPVSICAASGTPRAKQHAHIKRRSKRFVREALVEAIGRPSTLPDVSVAEFGRVEIVKLTLRMRQPDAETLVLNATGPGLS